MAAAFLRRAECRQAQKVVVVVTIGGRAEVLRRGSDNQCLSLAGPSAHERPIALFDVCNHVRLPPPERRAILDVLIGRDPFVGLVVALFEGYVRNLNSYKNSLAG